MKKVPVLSAVCVCLLLAASALAEVGRIAPVAMGVNEKPVRISRCSVEAREPAAFIQHGEGRGCVSPMATVVTLNGPGRTIALAIDTRRADDRLPNVVRIDPTGEGDFTKSAAVDVSARLAGGSFYLQIGPANVDFDIDGVTQPVRIEGFYSRMSSGNRYCQLELMAVREGQCKFGDTDRPVRLVDGTCNFRVNDKMVLGEKFGRLIEPTGDSIHVGAPDGTFTDSGPKAMVGSPIFVDGVWYNVTVSGDQTQVKAEPVAGECGTVRFGHEMSWARLVGQGRLLVMNVPREGLPVPAGTYEIIRYGEDKGDARHKITFIAEVEKTTAPVMVTVKPGETVDVTVGTPLVVKPDVARRGRRLTFDLKKYDSSGLTVNILGIGRPGDQRHPSAPRAKVYNQADELVHGGRFRYEGGPTKASHAWRVPADLKGTFKVFAEYENPPVEMTYEPAMVTLD